MFLYLLFQENYFMQISFQDKRRELFYANFLVKFNPHPPSEPNFKKKANILITLQLLLYTLS